MTLQLLLQNGIVVPVEVFVNQSIPNRNIFGVQRKKIEETEQKIDQAMFDKLTVSEKNYSGKLYYRTLTTYSVNVVKIVVCLTVVCTNVISTFTAKMW